MPHIYQIRPDGMWPGYSNGNMNCGPSSLAMIARYFGKGEGLLDAQLVDRLNRADGDDSGGSPPRDIKKQAKSIGLKADYRSGADTDWIASELRKGHKVIVRGDYRRGGLGHLMVVAGIDAKGDFIVNDPGRRDGRHQSFTPEQLTTYMRRHSLGGGQYSVRER